MLEKIKTDIDEGHKHVETEPSFLHKLATFLKYHMPLKSKFA